MCCLFRRKKNKNASNRLTEQSSGAGAKAAVASTEAAIKAKSVSGDANLKLDKAQVSVIFNVTSSFWVFRKLVIITSQTSTFG